MKFQQLRTDVLQLLFFTAYNFLKEPTTALQLQRPELNSIRKTTLPLIITGYNNKTRLHKLKDI